MFLNEEKNNKNKFFKDIPPPPHPLRWGEGEGGGRGCPYDRNSFSNR